MVATSSYAWGIQALFHGFDTDQHLESMLGVVIRKWKYRYIGEDSER